MTFKNSFFFLIAIFKLNLKYFYFCFFLSTLSSLLEFVTIGSIVPMLSVFLSSDVGQNYYFINYLLKNTFLEKNLLLFCLIFFSSFILASSLIKVLVAKYNSKYSALLSSRVATIIFENKLKQSYEDFISQNPNYLLTLLNNKISTLNTVLQSLFTFFTSLFVSLGILFFLIIYNYQLSFIVLAVYIFIYLFFGKFLKSVIQVTGKNLSNSLFLRSKIIQETSSSIKDIILNSSHDIFINIFRNLDFNIRILDSRLSYLNSIPRPILEAIGIIILIIFSYFLNFQTNNNTLNSNVIITIGVFTFAAQRLLPIFQSIYTSWSSIVSSYYIIVEIENIMKKDIYYKNFDKNNFKIHFKSQIEFKNVSFNYKNSRNLIFENLNLKINFGKKTCIIGRSGIGKTTLIDLLIGLLKPTSGNILVDDIKIDDINLNSWFNKIAYVSQDLVLINDTIMNNINYPNNEQANKERIEKVLIKSVLYDFVSRLPNKTQTIIGDGGINLSGGQKQRLLLARALYKKKEILILDEATNALDDETEKNILDLVLKDNQNMTIIFITHRINLLKNFDEIIDLNSLIKKEKIK